MDLSEFFVGGLQIFFDLQARVTDSPSLNTETSTLKKGLKANTKRKTRKKLLAKPQQRLDKSLPVGSMSVL